MAAPGRLSTGRLGELPARLGDGGVGWIVASSLVAWACLLAGDQPAGLIGLCSGAGPFGRVSGRIVGGGLMAAAMTMAMMLPLAIGNIRFVVLRSFPWRRARAVGWWLAGFLGVWLAVDLVASLGLVAADAGAGSRPDLAAAGFLAAALWQRTPAKRWALRACHHTAPLYPTGLRADASCLALGARIAGACVVGCGPMMLAAMAAPAPVAALGGVFAVALFERYVWRPPTGATAVAFALVGGALAVQALAA